MKRNLFLIAGLCFTFAYAALADSLTQSAQQKLKEEGFYYGETNGTKDAETVAAIRRFQIRNGLKVSGELDAGTQHSLGLTGSGTIFSPSATPSESAPPPKPPPPSPPSAAEESAPPRIAPERENIFVGTPYEKSSPQTQQRIIVGAQAVLMRRGYFHAGIDGIYGPTTQFSLRAFQSRTGLAPSGVLDFATLDALGLLPEQRAGERHDLPSHPMRQRWEIGPTGERIYLPN